MNDLALQVVLKNAIRTADYYQNVLGFELLSFFPLRSPVSMSS